MRQLKTQDSPLTTPQTDYLFYHILDGFKKSHEGLEFLVGEGMITKDEHVQMLRKNATRVIARIDEFKTKFLSFLFAGLFTWMQINGDNPDLRRPVRVRAGRSISRSGGSRKGKDGEPIEI